MAGAKHTTGINVEKRLAALEAEQQASDDAIAAIGQRQSELDDRITNLFRQLRGQIDLRDV